MEVNFILCIISQYYAILFNLVCGYWELFQLASLFFVHTPIILIFKHFFLATTRCHTLTFYVPCSRSTISHFTKELWFLSSENEIINQGLSPEWQAHCYWISLLFSPLCEYSKEVYEYMFTLKSTTIHLYISYVKQEFTLILAIDASNFLLFQTLLQLMTLYICQVMCVPVNMQDKFPKVELLGRDNTFVKEIIHL